MKLEWSFGPRLVDTLRNYSRQGLAADLIAGFTVRIFVPPLAAALGIASRFQTGSN